MEIFATLITSPANVAACRAAQTAAGFACDLADQGTPAAVTAHAASGWMPQAAVDAVAGLCSVVSVTPEVHDSRAVIAAAGKIIYSPPR